MRTFADQVKHVACANFAFAAELDGTKPPEACDKGGPSPARTRKELLIYLRDSFVALNKSLSGITDKNMFDRSRGLTPAPIPGLGWRKSASGMLPITTAKWRSTCALTGSCLPRAATRRQSCRRSTEAALSR